MVAHQILEVLFVSHLIALKLELLSIRKVYNSVYSIHYGLNGAVQLHEPVSVAFPENAISQHITKRL